MMKAELRAKFGNVVSTADLGAYNQDYYRRACRGELKRLGRGKWDLRESGDPILEVVGPISPEDLDAKIRQRFRVMSTLADGVIASNIRSLIISGAAGVGKTYELEKKLEAGLRNGEIDSFESVKGSISAVGLYRMLYDNRERGQVLLFDDCDAVYGDEEAMNLLKAALDTSTRRTISWQKASRWLEDQDIPNTFEYEGQIVFITNVDLERVVLKGGRLAPHMSALLSRSTFLDLCIHDTRSILIRVEQVLLESDLALQLGLDDDQVEQILEWLNSNVDALRAISIRTIVQLAGYIKTSETGWREIADVTLLKMAAF